MRLALKFDCARLDVTVSYRAETSHLQGMASVATSRRALAFSDVWRGQLFSVAGLHTSPHELVMQPLQRPLANIRERVKWHLFHRAQRRAVPRNLAFDARFGTDTAEEVQLVEAGLPSELAAQANTVYRPIWPALFYRTIDRLNLDLSTYRFIDYGSGKGKAMLMAADYPFREIIGIEFAPGLHKIAEENCRIYRSPHQRCFALAPLIADARTVALPPGDLVCFFFNPFDQETLRQVLVKIDQQAMCRSSDIVIIYCNLRNVRESGDAFDALQTFTRSLSTRRALIFQKRSGYRKNAIKPSLGWPFRPTATADRSG